MMVELKGSLGGIGLPALVQLIGELHHSGTLEFGREGTQGRLAFEDGHLVAAEFGSEHGLPALASVARTLKDADFTFIEGAPSPEQTLNFDPPELKSLLQRVMNGDFAAVEHATNHAAEHELEPPCPLLGFADDPERHYGRPTALHRCYASGGPSLVTSVEQRDLCLSGRFGTCPRYRNWETSPPPTRQPESAVGPAEAAPPAAAEETRPAPAREEQPEPELLAPASTERPDVPARAPRVRSLLPADLGGLQFMAIGVVLGVVVVFVVFAVILPALNTSPAQRPATEAAPALTLQTVPTAVSLPPTPLPAPTTAPTVVPAPTLAPAPTVAARASAPIVVVQPTAVQPTVATHSIMDIRFAQGPAKGWLDNPPFATWSAGAYRLQATQPARFVAVGVPTQAPLKDVLVTATFRKTGGSPGGGYGLIVRDQGAGPRDGENQEGKYYVAETGDLGDFGIWRRDGDQWVDLAPWAHSSSVRSGGSPNDLAVLAVGDEVTFVVNGAKLASVRDSTLGEGGIGIFVGGDYNEVAVDHFSVALPD